MIASWIVRQFKNDYNPIHYHSGQIQVLVILKFLITWVKLFKKIKQQIIMEN